MESTAVGSWVGEGGVDDVRFRHPKEQLAGADRRVSTAFRDFALVGSGIEFAEVGKNVRGEGQGFEDTGSVASGDEAVGSGLVEWFQMRHQ